MKHYSVAVYLQLTIVLTLASYVWAVHQYMYAKICCMNIMYTILM